MRTRGSKALGHLAIVWVGLLAGCALPDWLSVNRLESPKFYFSQMRTLQLEVAYERGAEPYTGTGIGGRPVWDFAEENLAALFRGRPGAVQVLIPKEIEQMQAFAAQGVKLYDTARIRELADRVRRNRAAESKGVFLVLFLNGQFAEDGRAKSSVLGISLTGSSVVALFKPVIRTDSRDVETNEFVAKYVEQSTLVHEIAHGIGLVGNGVPVTSPHLDREHGAHCTNTSCVMHWSHEGGTDLRGFVRRFVQTQDLVVFDEDCLRDAWSFRP
jgi:hypothetical protein